MVGFEARRFKRDADLQERDPLLLAEDQRLAERVEGVGRVGVGEGPPHPNQSERDPYRVGVGAGDGEGGYSPGFLGPPSNWQLAQQES